MLINEAMTREMMVLLSMAMVGSCGVKTHVNERGRTFKHFTRGALGIFLLPWGPKLS